MKTLNEFEQFYLKWAKHWRTVYHTSEGYDKAKAQMEFETLNAQLPQEYQLNLQEQDS